MSGSQADFWQGPSITLPVVNTNGSIFEEVQTNKTGTVLTIATFVYTPNTHSIFVWKNGILLRRASEYSETSSNTIGLGVAAIVTDVFQFVAFAISQLIIPIVNNGLPSGGTAGSVLQKQSSSDYDANWVAQTAVATLLDAARQNVASVSTISLVSIQTTTRNINITGNIQIDGFQVTNGQVWAVRFSGVLTLKNNANIVTQNGADIITTANATCFLRAVADNVVEVLSYSTPNGPIFANSVNGGPFGRRNQFINGGFTSCSRNSLVIAANNDSLTLDSWHTAIAATTVAATISQVTGASSATGCALSVVITTTGVGSVTNYQRIRSRNAKKLSGKQITISGRVKHNASTAVSGNIGLTKPTAVDNYGATTALSSSATFSCPNGNVDFDFSATLTLAATDADNGLQIAFNLFNLPALTGVTFLVSNMQIEVGANVTPFEDVGTAVTSLECSKSLVVTNYGTPKGTGPGSFGGIAVATSVIVSPLRYPVPMEATPTLQLWENGTQNQIRNTGTGVTQANSISGAVGANSAGFSGISFTAATLVVNSGYDFEIIASCEL